MNNHKELSDTEFEHEFETCSFNPSLFSHEAHLRLSWIHITKYGLDNAIENITYQLKKYVEYVGATDKYNETLTVAGIRAVHHFIKRSKEDTFTHFLAQNEQLKSNFKGLLSSHYSTDIFNSTEAKNRYLKPDLEPFE